MIMRHTTLNISGIFIRNKMKDIFDIIEKIENYIKIEEEYVLANKVMCFKSVL